MEDEKKKNNQHAMADSLYCTVRTAYDSELISLDNLRDLSDLITELYKRKKEESGK
jgi:hypothetical protein